MNSDLSLVECTVSVFAHPANVKAADGNVKRLLLLRKCRHREKQTQSVNGNQHATMARVESEAKL